MDEEIDDYMRKVSAHHIAFSKSYYGPYRLVALIVYGGLFCYFLLLACNAFM